MEEAHQQVQDFTGAPRGQAVAALHATGGNVQTAIEMLLEGVVFSEPAVGGEPAAIWEFDDHPNGYRVLAPATQTVLERAHSSGQTQATFIFRQFTYVADLANMTQTNTQTGMVRSLRRRGDGVRGAAGGAAPPAAHHAAKQGKAKKNKHSSRHHHVSSGDQLGAELEGVTYYDHTGEISADEMRRETQWKVLPAGAFDPTECDVITTEPFSSGPVVQLGCSGSLRGTRCVFRQDSIESALRSNHGRCPKCKEHYPKLSKGTQGSGQMSIRLNRGLQCSGFESADGTFTIRYTFGNGTQSSIMPQPGQPYTGTTRDAYYPNTVEGRKAVKMLRQAFMQGSCFNVGFSPTQGRDGTTVWGIHQKSQPHGGALQHGWPDDTYWQRLASELAAVGVYDEEFVSEAAAKRRQPAGEAGSLAATPAPEAGTQPDSEPEMIGKAFEVVLSLSALEEDARNALQQMRAEEAANSRLVLGSCTTAMRSRCSASHADVAYALCRARCEVTVLQLLRSWTITRTVELNRVQAELDALGAEIQELVRLEREAMSARLIPKMRSLMAERSQKSQRREALRDAAGKAAIAGAFETIMGTRGEVELRMAHVRPDNIEHELQLWRNEAGDIKAELLLHAEPADDDDEVV